MSLSETISRLEDNESIKFTKHLMGVTVIIKKGDHPKNNKTLLLTVYQEQLDSPAFDALAFEVDRALHTIRK